MKKLKNEKEFVENNVNKNKIELKTYQNNDTIINTEESQKECNDNKIVTLIEKI